MKKLYKMDCYNCCAIHLTEDIYCRNCGDKINEDIEIMRWYKRAVEQKDAQAEYNIGICYYYGHGVV